SRNPRDPPLPLPDALPICLASQDSARIRPTTSTSANTAPPRLPAPAGEAGTCAGAPTWAVVVAAAGATLGVRATTGAAVAAGAVAAAPAAATVPATGSEATTDGIALLIAAS